MRGWAEVCRFYGWTFADLRSMTVEEYNAARRYLIDCNQRQRGMNGDIRH